VGADDPVGALVGAELELPALTIENVRE
jgi:hypothetical protein